MTLGEHYFLEHPKLAFTVHALTMVALGYTSDQVLQYWFRESHLGLHITLWWTASVLYLIHISDKPKPLPQPERESQEFTSPVRLHALLFGDSATFYDLEAEQDEDYPTGTPLFRSICLSIHGWRLSTLKVSPDTGEQTACFIDQDDAHITVTFDKWMAWYIGIIELRANEEQTRNFLAALQSATMQIDGLSKIQWYSGDPNTFHAQMSAAEIELGADYPFDTAPVGT